VYPAVFVIYLISPDVILLASQAVMAQFSIEYNEDGTASVLFSIILVFFEVFCGLNTLLIMPVIFKYLFNLLSISTSFS